MKIEDVKIGMIVKHINYLKPLEVDCFWLDTGIVTCKHGDYILPISFNAKDLELVEDGEFSWDKSVPTIGKPMEHVGRWFIEIDSKVTIVFNKPISVYKYGFKTESYLIAIIKDHAYPFIFTEEATNTKCYLPVTYTPNVIELTVDILKEFYEQQNKIKVKIVEE